MSLPQAGATSELAAMVKIAAALDDLDPAARHRVLAWIASYYTHAPQRRQRGVSFSDTARRVREILTTEGRRMTPAEVWRALGESQSQQSVKAAMWRMGKTGELLTERGRYWLPEQSRA